MRYLFQSFFILILLIVLLFLAAPTRAQDSEATAPRGGAVEKVRESLIMAEKPELDLEGFLQLKAKAPLVILDVRSKARYDQSHIAGAINIPLTELTEKTAAAAIPDRQMPVVVVCDYSLAPTRMIAMTIQAWPVLHIAGYENIYRLNLWQGRNGMLTQEEIEKAISFEATAGK